jgi:integrase
MNEQWEKAKKILEKHNLPEKITQQNIKFLSALLVRDFEDLIDFEGIILQTNKELLDDFTRLSYYQILYWNYFLELEQYENCNVVKSSIQNLKNLTTRLLYKKIDGEVIPDEEVEEYLDIILEEGILSVNEIYNLNYLHNL